MVNKKDKKKDTLDWDDLERKFLWEPLGRKRDAFKDISARLQGFILRIVALEGADFGEFRLIDRLRS